MDERKFRNLLRLILICCWLLHDDWFIEHGRLSKGVFALFHKGLGALARLVDAELFVTDPDRREELVRLCLGALSHRPEGESEAQAADRLTTLDSVNRHKVIEDVKEREKRARKLRKKMEEKRAREAAAKASRE